MKKHQLAKRVAALSLAAALLLPTAAQAAYQDTAGHWAEAAIDKWSGEYGILKGYGDGTFQPDNTITRGAFAGILSRFLRYIKTADAAAFSDTAGDYWESDILKLNAARVYLGNGGKALIYDNITRQQAVAMIGRAFALQETEGELPYADGASVSDYAKGYLLTMERAGYITDLGADNRFRPTEAITRAEVVSLLNNIVSALFQSSGAYSQDVDGIAVVNATDGVELTDMVITGDLIIAPGVTGTVTLRDVTVGGQVRNLGDATVEQVTTEKPSGEEEASQYPWVSPSGYTTDGTYRIPLYDGIAVNPLTASDFYWDENGRLQCTNASFRTRFGIDVSAFQNRNCPDTTIDWEAVAADGVEFAMVRVALRGYTTGALHADAFYAQNIDGAMTAGIQTGVYIFSQAITVEEAIEEADYVISLLEGHQINGPVAYDWEMGTSVYRVYGIQPEVATACAVAFCQRIQEAGYQPLVYASRYVAYNKFNLPQLAEYPIWYPEYWYPTSAAEKVYPKLYYLMDYWQYTDKGSVSGIVGNVDMSLQLIPQ
jgi:GH25 family lysozyme M1 (1,4-beta-N-acetylmuramidase)